MKTAIRWGALLVIAATSATPLADDRAQDARGVEREGSIEKRNPEANRNLNERAESGAAKGEPSRAAEPRKQRVVVPAATDGRVVEAGSGATDAEEGSASVEERWLLEREGYRDGGY